MDVAWIGVIGTAAGTILGGSVSWLASRSEWSRQESVRWHDDRRAAYTEFLLAGDQYEELLYQLASEAASVADPWGVDRSHLDLAYERLRTASTQLMFFAGKDVAFWASQYIQLLVPAFGELMQDHEHGPYGWAAVNLALDGDPNRQFSTVRSSLVGAIRIELGLRSEVVWSPLPSGLGIQSPGRTATAPKKNQTSEPGSSE